MKVQVEGGDEYTLWNNPNSAYSGEFIVNNIHCSIAYLLRVRSIIYKWVIIRSIYIVCMFYIL